MEVICVKHNIDSFTKDKTYSAEPSHILDKCYLITDDTGQMRNVNKDKFKALFLIRQERIDNFLASL